MPSSLVYDFPEPCLSCGAMPTNRSNGLCRHCNDGGDIDDDNDDNEECSHGVGFDRRCQEYEGEP